MKKLKFITILFSIWLVKFTIDYWYSCNYNYLDENKYLDIEIKHISNNDIEFNNLAEAESFGDGEYGNNINFSTTPTRFKGMPLLTFVILKNNFERSGLYIIVNKQAEIK